MRKNPEMKPSASLIHIGLAKTATTSLQRNLLAHHREIYYFGYENCELSMRWIINMIKSQDSLDYKQSQVDDVVERIFQKNPLKNRKLVVSDEFFTLPYHPGYSAVDRGEIARRLLGTFGQAKILLVIRRPHDLLGGLYSEWMKWYGEHHFSRIDFNKWVTSMLNRPQTTWLSILKYYDLYKAYKDIFGDDSIIVYLYEDIAKDNPAFARKFCELIGVSSKEAGELFSRKQYRSRMTKWEIQERMTFAQNPGLGRLYFKIARRRPIRYVMNRILPGRQKAGTRMSQENATRIQRRFCSQYERLALETGLNLKDYGYYD